MKRFLAMLLAALMLLSGLSALAEDGTFYEEMGFALDIDDIQAKTQNCVVLQRTGVDMHEPFAAMMIVVYYALPEATVKDIEAEIAKAEDDTEKAMLTYRLQMMGAGVGVIIVTNAESLADIGITWPLPEEFGVTELGAVGNYRWYYISQPVDTLLDSIDETAEAGNLEIDPEATKQAVLADAEMIRAEMLKKLEAVQLTEPVDNDTGHVGEVLSFRTTDLDGNPVSSEDLFKDNRITMVNVWGSWCVNCINEMAELAQLHHRLQEKGCGIVGLEFEQKPIEAVADTARAVMTANGTTYPNAIKPKGNPILDQFSSYPTTLFVDSEGRILTYPIIGAAVAKYEPTVEALLAGESADVVTGTGAVANGDNKYCVYVYDPDGNPVQGVFIQFCDDTTCAFQPTDANGRAEFSVDVEKVYEVHVLQAPEGYRQDERAYETLDSYSDVNIFLEKAE